MTEHPITLPAWGIRALDHGKSQFRVPLLPQPPEECSIHYMLGQESWKPKEKRTPLRHNWEAWSGPLYKNRPGNYLCGIHSVPLPWQVGDRLWVQEAWFINHHDYYYDQIIPKTKPDIEDYQIVYWATEDDPEILYEGEPWSADTMPRWAARHVLTVTGLRVERVGDISEADAIAEGFGPYANSQTIDCDTKSPKQVYRRAWQADHPDHPWPDSWLLVTEFEQWQ